ncbi:MAG: sigma-70 family RNA polymerase sigma factor [Planctomycetes bacterium]|nr:sigma-70 family RNA polymerase sigma factor [Planctomycetota bacterium]
MRSYNTSIARDNFGFPNTVWGVVIQAKDRNAKECREKLGELISMYWPAVYKYIRNMWNKSNEEAKDLAQEFFTVFLEKDYLKPVSKDKGKFRTYVKTTLKHFLINSQKRQNAQKRGGDAQTVSYSGVQNESVQDERTSEPADFFDREWSRTIITKSIENLRKKLVSENKHEYFEVFDSYYNSSNKSTYKEISRKLGIKDTDVTNYLSYTKLLLKKLIRKEVCAYVADEVDVEDELKYILSIKFRSR